ncbi:hypothetical protein BEL04_16850 [Mucilaginibacter sp. PPCGB 2223]|uniref:DUF3667 domain-containing protein n=1 Tax=Mucilaginibacter sp. PPCGB 2223 TaxID=1886027 RepID=UPI000824611A|nr:DUF3667 domain-containing protein [Mucilaginibacter sp. PPCGB 2223]OCX51685.1 hypothetical protein BEL04_16850 [Mucilaginibacter sp. PPCGB 2223]
MKKHYRTENNCLNCGNTFEGHFCNNCGQENLELKEDFGHLMVHAVGDYFHFDEKFFHTLKPLLFEPGKLTVDYMAGKRTQYLHPIRMYIFISLVYFILLFNNNSKENRVEQKHATTEHVVDSVNRAINDYHGLTPAQKKALQQKTSGFNINKKIRANDKNTASIGSFGSIVFDDDSTATYEQYLQKQQKLPVNKRDGFIDRYLNKKYYEWKARGQTPNEAILEGFKHNFPKMMFLLLPLFAWFLKVTFRKNHKYYVEHLIYSFHLHCFVFLFLIFIMLIKMLLPDSWLSVRGLLDLFSFVTIIWYVYRSLRIIYQRSRFRTITKIISISIAYWASFMVCIVFVFILSAMLA